MSFISNFILIFICFSSKYAFSMKSEIPCAFGNFASFDLSVKFSIVNLLNLLVIYLFRLGIFFSIWAMTWSVF